MLKGSESVIFKCFSEFEGNIDAENDKYYFGLIKSKRPLKIILEEAKTKNNDFFGQWLIDRSINDLAKQFVFLSLNIFHTRIDGFQIGINNRFCSENNLDYNQAIVEIEEFQKDLENVISNFDNIIFQTVSQLIFEKINNFLKSHKLKERILEHGVVKNEQIQLEILKLVKRTLLHLAINKVREVFFKILKKELLAGYSCFEYLNEENNKDLNFDYLNSNCKSREFLVACENLDDLKKKLEQETSLFNINQFTKESNSIEEIAKENLTYFEEKFLVYSQRESVLFPSSVEMVSEETKNETEVNAKKDKKSDDDNLLSSGIIITIGLIILVLIGGLVALIKSIFF